MSRPLSRRLRLALLILVALAAATAHRQALRADLIFDDVEIVRDNRRLDADDAGDWGALLTSGYWQGDGRDLLWRPLTLASFAVQRAAGTEAPGYHAVNVLLHAAVAAVLFLLALRLGSDHLTASLAALLLAAHPLASEAVTLVVGRADLLVALGALGVLLLLQGRHLPARRGWRLAGIALLTAAACLAKENGFVLPLLAALAILSSGLAPAGVAGPGAGERGGRRPGLRRTDLMALATVATAAAAVLAIRVAILGRLMRAGPPALSDNPIAHAPFWDGKLEALRLLARAVGLFVWPGTLSVDYSYAAITVPPVDAVAVVSIIAGLAAAVLLFWMLRHRPLALFGGLFFLAAHLLTANLITPIGTIFGERLLYLPMVGLCLLAADLAGSGVRGLQRLAAGRPAAESARTGAGRGPDGPRRSPALVSALLAVGLAAGTALLVRTDLRERDYASDLTLWRATVEAVPRSAKARYNHGRSLAARGEHQAALAEYRQSLTIFPEQLEALNNLAATWLRLERPEEALAALDRAVALDPEAAEVAFNRALALHRLGRRDDAAREFGRGAALDPGRARELADRGAVWAELLREAASLPPHEPAGPDPPRPR